MNQVKHEVFLLKKTAYSDKKISCTIPFPSVTNLNLWLNENGLVIGLDFITVTDQLYINKTDLKRKGEKK